MDTETKLRIASILVALLFLIIIYCYFYAYLVEAIENNMSLEAHCVIINIFLIFLLISSCCFLSFDYYSYRKQNVEFSRLNTILIIGFLLVVIFCVASIELMDPHTVTLSKLYWVTAFISCIIVVLLFCHFQFSVTKDIVISQKVTSVIKIKQQQQPSALHIQQQLQKPAIVPTTQTFTNPYLDYQSKFTKPSKFNTTSFVNPYSTTQIYQTNNTASKTTSTFDNPFSFTKSNNKNLYDDLDLIVHPTTTTTTKTNPTTTTTNTIKDSNKPKKTVTFDSTRNEKWYFSP